MSLIVDAGACEIVVDPRHLPDYPPTGIEAFKSGDAFLIAAGDPIPQLGEKNVVVCIERGEVKSIKAHCSTVAQPLLSVKGMTEAGQFVGFCQDCGFVLDLAIGKLDWFREGNGDCMLDAWLVP